MSTTTSILEPGKLDLDALNPMFESASPVKIIEWAVRQFGDELVMTSSFGAESAVMIHMAIQYKPDIPIIFVDTGYLFPETHAFMEDLRRRFKLRVWSYRTRNDPIAYLKRVGETDPEIRHNIPACCAANKHEPIERAFAELSPRGWLRGVRRDQAETREVMGFVEWFKRYGCYAVSPLLSMSKKEIYFYMKEHNLPYHPLYQKGYESVGCNPLTCTQAVKPGEDPRSGRWAGLAKVECGINLANLDQGSGI